MITGILSILRRPCRGGNGAPGEEVSRVNKKKKEKEKKEKQHATSIQTCRYNWTCICVQWKVFDVSVTRNES